MARAPQWPPTSRLDAIANSCSAWKPSFAASRGWTPIACIAFSTRRSRAVTWAGWCRGSTALTQIGLACRRPQRPDLSAFLRKVTPHFDLRDAQCLEWRGGLIPVGGPVSPMAARDVLLIGDAAGLVSPLSAGGIHTALESGWAAAQAIADHQLEGGEDPGRALARRAPRFVWKRVLRMLYDRGVPNAVFDAALSTRPFTALARSVYFHHRGLRSAEGWRDLAQTLLRGHP